jgi:hypothetical protein
MRESTNKTRRSHSLIIQCRRSSFPSFECHSRPHCLARRDCTFGYAVCQFSWHLTKPRLTYRSTHLQLLRFHSFFLELYPSSIVPVEYPTRLLKLSLGHLSPLLDPKQTPAASTPAANDSSSSSKKGKKRARGAEDGLVGGLEGRDRSNLASEEIDVIVESLKCKRLLLSRIELS